MSAVPWAVYGITEAAGVGMTEQEAQAKGIEIKKASLPLKVSGRFCAENGFAAQGAVKVIADARDGQDPRRPRRGRLRLRDDLGRSGPYRAGAPRQGRQRGYFSSPDRMRSHTGRGLRIGMSEH